MCTLKQLFRALLKDLCTVSWAYFSTLRVGNTQLERLSYLGRLENNQVGP